MSLPPEANSLSSITQLAGNPPQYPRNPAEKKRDSLVLYIARVPGSKDIILTTMKPRLKNVTAEDVMNSLYYLHLDTSSDLLLVDQTEHAGNAAPGLSPPKAMVARKPLLTPPTAISLPATSQSFGINGTTESLSMRMLQDANSNTIKTQQIIGEVKPHLPSRPSPAVNIVEDMRPPIPTRQPPAINVAPARRPLGPRPLTSQPQISQQLLPGEENIPIKTNMLPEVLGARTLGPDSYQFESSTTKSPKIESAGNYSWSDKTPSQGVFSITLIRRDPTSGAQWNIGKIVNGSTLEVRSPYSQQKASISKPSSSLSVHLTTLGYGKFRGLQGHQNKAADNARIAGPQKTPGVQNTFDCQVRMEWSSFWKRKFKQHRRGLSDQSEIRKTARGRSGTDDEPGKLGRKSGEHEGVDQESQPLIPECGFLSPWNGRCEFTAGNGGRTLKCKHTLPSPVSVSNIVSASAASATVSELRFNLPSVVMSSSSIQSNSSYDLGISSISKSPIIRKKLPSDSQEALPNPNLDPTSYAALYPSDDETDSSDHLDLSLGREKAGGGIRGKRVKLGKLIVHDEGMKMLDLIVAANMGIWWTIWDR